MKLRFTRRAVLDLIEIADYIGMDEPRRGQSYARHLKAEAAAIVDLPLGYMVIHAAQGREIRRKPVGSYVILYSVGPNQVEILRVISAARDLERVLGEIT